MGYEVAINKAWQELQDCNPPAAVSVRFLADTYAVNTQEKTVVSFSCNVPAKDFSTILILHYLARQCQGLPALSGQWQTFREFSGIEGYAEAFRNRVIKPIIRKYGKNPQGIFEVINRVPGRKTNQADAAIVVDVFEGVPALIELWAGDDEFGPEANMLFDKSIIKVFCTEDIVVLAGMIAASL